MAHPIDPEPLPYVWESGAVQMIAIVPNAHVGHRETFTTHGQNRENAQI
jgi:hypothetical protein